MNKRCPSSFALDAFRLGFDNTWSDHVQGCSHCAAWLADQERLEVEVAHLWVPAEPKSPRPTKTLLRYFLRLGLPVVAGAVMILFLVMPRPPTETAKGGPALVQIARLRAGILSWLSPPNDLQPNDSIRFFIHRNDPGDRYALISSVDGSQQLTHFYPSSAHGCSVSLPPDGEAIEGSIVIDAAPGPERMVVVLSHQPLCWPTVDEAIRRFALGDPLAGVLVSHDVHATRLIFNKQLRATP
jgi:hypothetical protein